METVYIKREKMRRRIVSASICMISVLSVICFAVPGIVHAGFGDAYATPMISAIVEMLSGDQLQYCKDIMLGTNSGFQAAVIGESGIGTILSKVMIGFGYVFVFMRLSSEIGKELLKGTIGTELILRISTKLVIALTVLLYCDSIINGIVLFSNAMVTIVSNKIVLAQAQNFLPPDPTTGNILSEIGETVVGGFKTIVIGMELVIPYFLLKLDNIVIKTISYALFIEFAVRRAFLPIAVTDVISAGVRSPGVRYFKKFFSLYIRMIIVLMTVAVSWQLIYTTVVISSWNVLFGSVGAIYDVICLLGAGKVVMNNGAALADEIICQ